MKNQNIYTATITKETQDFPGVVSFPNKPQEFKEEIKTLMKKYKVKCEKRTFEDSNGNYETIDVLVGGEKTNHRYEIFIPVKDIFL